MLALTNNAINELNYLKNKWHLFKKNRHSMKFEITQGKNFITGLEREQMIDDLFNIYKYQTEEIKILDTKKIK